AFDGAGELFESDLDSGNIYRFTLEGVRSTVASGLGNPTGVAFAPNLTTTPPTVQVVASDYLASGYGDGTNADTGEFVFWRNGDTNTELTVYYALSGTASNGVNYEALSGSVTFPTGATYTTLKVTPIRGSTTGDDETVVLALRPDAAYTAGRYQTDTVRFYSNRALPGGSWHARVFATKETVSEDGPAPGEFIFTRAHGFRSMSFSATLNYTISGTANNGVDYETLSGSVTIPAGAAFAHVTVRPIDDDRFGGTRTVTLRIATMFYIPDYPNDTATVFIRDNDPPPTTETVWVDDTVPAGAWTGADGGDSWNWVSENPPPFIGTVAHQSARAPGIHCHYFAEATDTLLVNPGDRLFTYVYLDSANPPREVMLSWFDGASWSHVAYWGENLIPWGTDGTASQRPMGALPTVGQWVRLEVAASAVALEGSTLSGMNFVVYDGQATWDFSGKTSQ